MSKPKLCEVLGVEVDEEFRSHIPNLVYHIDNEGHSTGVTIPLMFGIPIYTYTGDRDFTVRFGDYLVKDGNKNFFLKSRDIFELCYELMEEEG